MVKPLLAQLLIGQLFGTTLLKEIRLVLKIIIFSRLFWKIRHRKSIEKKKEIFQDNFAFFALAIGSGAPYANMDRMAQLNHGAARQIFDGIDVPDQMKDFYNGIANPLIWNLNFRYSNTDEVAIS